MDNITIVRIVVVRVREVMGHLRKANHRYVARMAIGSHLIYYSLCFVEAHGTYGYAAGLCGLVLLIETIFGSDEGEHK